MNKRITLILLTICLLFSPTLLRAQAKVPRQQFIKYMLAYANDANQSIVQQRQQLLALDKKHEKKKSLSAADTAWLKKLAKQYKLPNANFNKNHTWKRLIKRVDIIPPSLLIAQAANESGWGTSRFAKQANNYFGQWCYSRGCGLVPKQRGSHMRHEVKKFKDKEASVSSYIHNLNTNPAYTTLRDIRFKKRQSNKTPDGMSLANGLNRYSQRGQAYVVSIKSLIRHYHLAKFDIT